MNNKVKNLLLIESKQYLTYGKFYNDLRRNFDYMILGSSKVKKFYHSDSSKYKYLNYAFYDRSLLIDIDVLKNLFSLVKSEGMIIITIDYPNNIRRMNYITPLDKLILHPIILKKYNFHFLRLHLELPLLYNPIFSLKYLFYEIIDNENSNKTWELKQSSSNTFRFNNEIYISRIQNSIEDTIIFCNERSLKIKIVFIDSDASSINANKILLYNLKMKFNSLDLAVVKNQIELNNLFNN
jgi:hypothetical protein